MASVKGKISIQRWSSIPLEYNLSSGYIWIGQFVGSYCVISFSFLFFFRCLFNFERETECEQGRMRERGRHRIWSRLHALSCQHRARRGARTHELWDHDLSWSRTLNQMSHSGAPSLSSTVIWNNSSQAFYTFYTPLLWSVVFIFIGGLKNKYLVSARFS